MLNRTRISQVTRLARRNYRDEEDVFVAEGPRLVAELLELENVPPRELYATGDWIHFNKPLVEKFGSMIIEIENHELERLSQLKTPNQVVGVFYKPRFPEPEFRGRLTLALDAIQDPGNMGTIVRCADWFGIKTVVAGPACADVFNPKVVQSTMGSAGRVHVVNVENLYEFLESHSDVPAYAATLDGTPLPQLEPIAEGFLLIGNEAKGLSGKLLEHAAHRVTIPRVGQAESLNAGVATGILLSHLAPQNPG